MTLYSSQRIARPLCWVVGVFCIWTQPPAQATDFTVYSTIFPRLAEPSSDGVTGLYADLLQNVESKTGHRFTWQFEPWPRAQQSARTDPKGLIVNFTRTPEREPLYRWVGAIGWGRYGIFMLKDSPVQTLADAKALTIGYLNGSEVMTVLKDAGFKNMDSANSSEANARKLHGNRIDGWAVNLWTAPSVYRQAGFSTDDLRALPLNEPWDQWLAASLQFPSEAAVQIGNALRELKNDGTTKTLEAKYWSGMPGMPNPQVAKGR